MPKAQLKQLYHLARTMVGTEIGNRTVGEQAFKKFLRRDKGLRSAMKKAGVVKPGQGLRGMAKGKDKELSEIQSKKFVKGFRDFVHKEEVTLPYYGQLTVRSRYRTTPAVLLKRAVKLSPAQPAQTVPKPDDKATRAERLRVRQEAIDRALHGDPRLQPPVQSNDIVPDRKSGLDIAKEAREKRGERVFELEEKKSALTTPSQDRTTVNIPGAGASFMTERSVHAPSSPGSERSAPATPGRSEEPAPSKPTEQPAATKPASTEAAPASNQPAESSSDEPEDMEIG